MTNRSISRTKQMTESHQFLIINSIRIKKWLSQLHLLSYYGALDVFFQCLCLLVWLWFIRSIDSSTNWEICTNRLLLLLTDCSCELVQSAVQQQNRMDDWLRYRRCSSTQWKYLNSREDNKCSISPSVISCSYRQLFFEQTKFSQRDEMNKICAVPARL